MNQLGYMPMQLQLDKSVVLPGLVEGSLVTDSLFESEMVEKLILIMKTTIKNFRVANFQEKISESVAQRVPNYRG